MGASERCASADSWCLLDERPRHGESPPRPGPPRAARRRVALGVPRRGRVEATLSSSAHGVGRGRASNPDPRVDSRRRRRRPSGIAHPYRAKPAVPFAGTHRLIDFPLSNCLNAQIDDVWMSQQFNPVSLTDHLANGRPWDLDRTSGGLLQLHPREGNESDGVPAGDGGGAVEPRRADPRVPARGARGGQRGRGLQARLRALVEEHREAGKAVTMVTTEVDPDEAGRYGVVQRPVATSPSTSTSPMSPAATCHRRGLRLLARAGPRGARRIAEGKGRTTSRTSATTSSLA